MKSGLQDIEHRIEIHRDQQDLWRVAAQKMLGVSHGYDFSRDVRGVVQIRQAAVLPPEIPTFSSLQEMFACITGDTSGDFSRIAQIANLSTFKEILRDALERRLVADYKTAYHWRDIASMNSAESFYELKRPRVRHVADLASVGEEGYPSEVVVHGDEAVSYGGVDTKVAFLTVTREAFLNNDIAGLERILDQMRRAAERTLARRAWSKIINNDNYPVDGLPMFHADHGNNLGSTALSIASLIEARQAMGAQTEPGSDEPLGLGGGNLLLVVPVGLESTAFGINNCEYGVFEGNPWLHRFGISNERIFANPFFTDESDWALFDISGDVGILETSFLMGRQVPQLELANDPREGLNLSNDKLCYKLRHEYEVGILDYRGAYKAEVA